MRTCAISKEIELLLLDAVLHVAAGAVLLFVKHSIGASARTAETPHKRRRGASNSIRGSSRGKIGLPVYREADRPSRRNPARCASALQRAPGGKDRRTDGLLPFPPERSSYVRAVPTSGSAPDDSACSCRRAAPSSRFFSRSPPVGSTLPTNVARSGSARSSSWSLRSS